MIRDIANGLKHCHGHGVIHLDIKVSSELLGMCHMGAQDCASSPLRSFATQPDNIYISPSDDDKTAVYKIGDFGNAVLNGQWTTEEGDGGYVAPELLANEAAASPACDIYSFGATIYEVASGSRVPRASELRTCGVPRPPESCSDALARADPLNLSARSHPALTGQAEQ